MINNLLLLFFFLSTSFTLLAQKISEKKIREIAIEANKKIRGLEIEEGITALGCYSIGRTLIYKYEVSNNWLPVTNIKKKLISNFKTAGQAKTYFLNDIDVSFYYYRESELLKKIDIKSNEFSPFNYELGEYISLHDHPKSKGVNIKLKVPIGWDIEEGDRPNIVKKFVKDGNAYMVQIRENVTFFSRNEIKELFEEDDFVKGFLDESISYLNKPELLDKSIISIENYPTIYFKAKGSIKRSGLNIPMIMKCWYIFYEDKLVFLQAVGSNTNEFNALENLYFRITNSLIFPDQYN